MSGRQADEEHDRICRWFKYYLGRQDASHVVLRRAMDRFPGISAYQLETALWQVMQWKSKCVPRLTASFRTMGGKSMWPEDYVDYDDNYRVTLAFRDASGVYQAATLVLPYRPGMDLQSAFDEARSAALEQMGASQKIRDLVEQHAEDLTVTIEPRMGPLPEPGQLPNEPF